MPSADRLPLSLPVLLLAALAACTATPGAPPVTGIREVGPGQVAGCSAISTFRDSPDVYGLLAQKGIAYARQGILQAAKDAGADTVVFDPAPVAGGPVTEITATAYRC